MPAETVPLLAASVRLSRGRKDASVGVQYRFLLPTVRGRHRLGREDRLRGTVP
jgi:hypothetical protein